MSCAFQHLGADILAMNMIDAPGMTAGYVQNTGAGIGEVPGIEKETHRGPG
jgi:hypothetical protein